jgi:16S rRNA (adenine1518-N6/adenine1519-N6)-dimethyltransferase
MPRMPFPEPVATLRRYDLRPKKSFGQNFIREPNVVERIADLCPPTPCRVVEIGAGLGALTFALLERGHRVTAIERDRDLVPALRELAHEANLDERLTLLEADAKTVDLNATFASMAGDSPRLLLGNVPYNLTGLLLRQATECAAELELVMFLVQREVADRLGAPPDSDAYGALSVFAQAAFDVEPAFVVGRGAFYPVPNVDSRVVRLRPLHPPRAQETEPFRALVKAAFEKRRKTLRNAWTNVLGKDRPALEEAATAAGVSLDARGETLSVDDFRRMGEALFP